MNPRVRKFKWLRWCLVPPAVFIAIVAWGYIKERRAVNAEEKVEQARRERIAEVAEDRQRRVALIRVGDRVEKVRLLLPEARHSHSGTRKDLEVHGCLKGAVYVFEIKSGRVASIGTHGEKRQYACICYFPLGPCELVWWYFRRGVGMVRPAVPDDPPPATLEEAHGRLELWTSSLPELDAAKSEEELDPIEIGQSYGVWDEAGQWRETPLSRQMMKFGYTRPDDISRAILASFWCKRHGKPYRLEERAVEYASYWDRVRKVVEEDDRRLERSQ